MIEIGEPASWIEANQCYLAAELQRLRRRIEGGADADLRNRGAAPPKMSTPARGDCRAPRPISLRRALRTRGLLRARARN